MIQRRKRVNKKDFQTTMKNGKIFSSPLFIFRYLNQEKPQYSFVISKNTYKKAVDRNKLRRLGYNIFRTLPVLNGMGIFFYKKEAKKATKEEISENIFFLLKKARILTE